MAVITGTGTFTQNSTAISSITGLSQSMIGTVLAGNWLKVDGESILYYLSANASTETDLVLWQQYGGTTGSKDFEIYTSFLNYDIVLLDNNMSGVYQVLNEIHRKLINSLVAAGAPSENQLVLTRQWLGSPQDTKEWGYFKVIAPIQIDTIRLYTDLDSPDNTITLDLSIDDIDQNLALQLTNGNTMAENTSLSTIVNAGSYVKLKWSNITLPAGQDYFVDIFFHTTSVLDIRYDYNKSVFGVLSVGDEIGKYFKFPVKSKVFAVSVNFDDYTGEGGDIIIELYKNNAALGVPVKVTITEGMQNFYSALSQTNFETTDYCSLKIVQLGIIPPNQINFILYSYQIE